LQCNLVAGSRQPPAAFAAKPCATSRATTLSRWSPWISVLDRTARAAQLLQVGGDPGQLRVRQPADDRHRLALAAALLAPDADRAAAGRFDGRRRLVLAAVAELGGVDEAAFGHDGMVEAAAWDTT
jgi:hypothetical protein